MVIGLGIGDDEGSLPVPREIGAFICHDFCCSVSQVGISLREFFLKSWGSNDMLLVLEGGKYVS